MLAEAERGISAEGEVVAIATEFELQSTLSADLSRLKGAGIEAERGFKTIERAVLNLKGTKKSGNVTMTTTTNVEGVQRIQQSFKAMPEALRAVLGQELFWEAQEAYLKSQELVPVDTGTLKSSGTVVGPVDEGDTLSVTIGYGGAAGEYAVYVHEDLEASHLAPTQAKFLEAAIIEQSRLMGRRISEVVRNTLGKMVG